MPWDRSATGASFQRAGRPDGSTASLQRAGRPCVEFNSAVDHPRPTDLSIPAGLAELFVTAGETPATAHVRMQAALQEHVDSAISKTINLSHDASTRTHESGRPTTRGEMLSELDHVNRAGRTRLGTLSNEFRGSRASEVGRVTDARDTVRLLAPRDVITKSAQCRGGTEV